jgi:competence protein ComEC
MSRLESGFPGASGEEPRRFLGAILLGARDGGEGDLDRVFRRTGVYHILSISGLHFALLMSCLHRLGRRGRLAEPLQAMVMGGVGGFYILLSGGDDPILRCGIAGLAHGAGSLTGRRISACDAQTMAATALLVLRPLHLFQPGFQLSFLVTYGVLSGSRPWWPRLRSIPVAGDALAVSSSAWIASTPVMATLFLQVSPIALALNLVAAPFLAVSLAMGVGILFLPCWGLEKVFAVCFHGFGSICAGSMALPGAFLRVPAPNFPLLSGLTALRLVRVSLPCSPSGRVSRLLSGGVLLGVLLVCVPPPLWSPPSPLSLTVLDVGQGDSLLVGFPEGRWALIDAGGFAGSDFDVGERVVLPALLAMGVRRLDLLVLTHAHQDHGGGMPALVEALPIGEIWIGREPPGSRLVERIVKLARERQIPVLHPMRGSLRCMSGACMEVLHPPPGYRRGLPPANDDSLVLRVTHLESSLLLTGDVESEGEALLLDPAVPLSAQLLKVPHHGSDSSSSLPFLKRVSPSTAIISVGIGNPWGHPSGRVLERLQALRIRTERTDREGAIRYVAAGSTWRKEPMPE